MPASASRPSPSLQNAASARRSPETIAQARAQAEARLARTTERRQAKQAVPPQRTSAEIAKQKEEALRRLHATNAKKAQAIARAGAGVTGGATSKLPPDHPSGNVTTPSLDPTTTRSHRQECLDLTEATDDETEEGAEAVKSRQGLKSCGDQERTAQEDRTPQRHTAALVVSETAEPSSRNGRAASAPKRSAPSNARTQHGESASCRYRCQCRTIHEHWETDCPDTRSAGR